jgi:hypothetical protein
MATDAADSRGKGDKNVSSPEKRRRRVEIMIDQRMLSFLKPTPLPGPSLARRRRDSLEFLSPLNQRGQADPPQDRTGLAS